MNEIAIFASEFHNTLAAPTRPVVRRKAGRGLVITHPPSPLRAMTETT
jgi:hypothetical protein